MLDLCGDGWRSGGGLELRYLVTLATVGREASFSKAADVLGYSRPPTPSSGSPRPRPSTSSRLPTSSTSNAALRSRGGVEAAALAGTVQFIRSQELPPGDRVDALLETMELFTAVYRASYIHVGP